MSALFTTGVGLFCPQHFRSRERDRCGVGWRQMEEGIMLDSKIVALCNIQHE
jgi:hypothetical protein